MSISLEFVSPERFHEQYINLLLFVLLRKEGKQAYALNENLNSIHSKSK